MKKQKKTPAPPLHPLQTLPELLDHVLYEMHMAAYTYLRLKAGMPRGEDSSIVLESFIVHLRCLNEFFCKDSAEQRLKPWDFCTGYRKEPNEHPEIVRMHCEIAHLTRDRKKPGATDGRGNWEIKTTARTIFVLCQKFLRTIQSDKSLMDYARNAARTADILAFLDTELRPTIAFPNIDLSAQEYVTSSTSAYTPLLTGDLKNKIVLDSIQLTYLPTERERQGNRGA